MKRSPLGPRKAPMNRGTPIPRGEQPAKPTRPKVTAEERRTRRIVAARSGQVCEMCGRRPATDMHHRVNRSQGGAWSPENILHLCHEDHMAVTVNPRLARERGWSLLSTQPPASSSVFLAGRGWVLLRGDGAIEEAAAA